MVTTNNPEALARKYNYEPGIECRINNAGVFNVIKWPESLPKLTQAIVDQAELEYAQGDAINAAELIMVNFITELVGSENPTRQAALADKVDPALRFISGAPTLLDTAYFEQEATSRDDGSAAAELAQTTAEKGIAGRIAKQAAEGKFGHVKGLIEKAESVQAIKQIMDAVKAALPAEKQTLLEEMPARVAAIISSLTTPA